MTSELRVDNLKGSTTGGSINVLGEGTSATTNLQQGLVKVWCKFQGDASNIFTDANFDNFNISGLTDNGTGDYTYTIANDFRAATVYCAAGMCRSVGSGAFLHSSKQGDAVNKNAGTMRIYTGNSAGQAADSGDVDTIFHGDLA
jgi:hypothetical protein